MYLVINKCVAAAILSNFSRHYLRNRSTLDIGVLGYIVYFNLRNILPKSGTFLPGHPVYCNAETSPEKPEQMNVIACYCRKNFLLQRKIL